jgi:hypothetical protein
MGIERKIKKVNRALEKWVNSQFDKKLEPFCCIESYTCYMDYDMKELVDITFRYGHKTNNDNVYFREKVYVERKNSVDFIVGYIVSRIEANQEQL